MRIVLLSLFITFGLFSDAQVFAKRNPLIGTWRLISSQTTVTDGGKTQEFLAENPKGYLILTPEGRLMTIGTTGDRKKIPATDADAAQLWGSMVAYTGRYRIEDNDLVTRVDVSWNEGWIDTDQKRHYEIEPNKLTVVSAPQPVGAGPRPNAMFTSTLVFEREK